MGRSCSGVDEQSDDLTNRPLSPDGFGQGEIALDAIAIAATLLLLDDVASLDQVVDNAERAALRDIDIGGNLA
jgi:hypothetical protein